MRIEPLTAKTHAEFQNRATAGSAEVAARAARIVADVREGGDEALLRWTKELDGAQMTTPFLDSSEWSRLADACPAAIRTAIDGNLGRIRAFHSLQKAEEQTVEPVPGLLLGRRPVPYKVAGCYVPGGRASYPSSVLMTVVPAALAGVKRIVIATPPDSSGTIDSAVAYAARAAGATDILVAGGAQAIAALAYGTETVPAVDCIVGPGNAYVTAAKQLVSSTIWTDAPAGPSELLVIADADANVEWIARDLMAQAEHDPDAQCILVTPSQEVATAVVAQLDALVPAADRRKIIEASLRDHGRIFVADDLDSAVAFSNAYAPEHLEIHTANPRDVLDRIRNAGSVFLGGNSPVSYGDYGSGTNHVLPTMGNARIRGGLSLDDFRKWVTWQQITPEAAGAISADVIALANAEGLHAHAAAVEARLP